MEKNKQFGCQHTSSPTIWEDGRLVGGLEEWEKLVAERYGYRESRPVEEFTHVATETHEQLLEDRKYAEIEAIGAWLGDQVRAESTRWKALVAACVDIFRRGVSSQPMLRHLAAESRAAHHVAGTLTQLLARIDRAQQWLPMSPKLQQYLRLRDEARAKQAQQLPPTPPSLDASGAALAADTSVALSTAPAGTADVSMQSAAAVPTASSDAARTSNDGVPADGAGVSRNAGITIGLPPLPPGSAAPSITSAARRGRRTGPSSAAASAARQRALEEEARATAARKAEQARVVAEETKKEAARIEAERQRIRVMQLQARAYAEKLRELCARIDELIASRRALNPVVPESAAHVIDPASFSCPALATFARQTRDAQAVLAEQCAEDLSAPPCSVAPLEFSWPTPPPVDMETLLTALGAFAPPPAVPSASATPATNGSAAASAPGSGSHPATAAASASNASTSSAPTAASAAPPPPPSKSPSASSLAAAAAVPAAAQPSPGAAATPAPDGSASVPLPPPPAVPPALALLQSLELPTGTPPPTSTPPRADFALCRDALGRLGDWCEAALAQWAAAERALMQTAAPHTPLPPALLPGIADASPGDVGAGAEMDEAAKSKGDEEPAVEEEALGEDGEPLSEEALAARAAEKEKNRAAEEAAKAAAAAAEAEAARAAAEARSLAVRMAWLEDRLREVSAALRAVGGWVPNLYRTRCTKANRPDFSTFSAQLQEWSRDLEALWAVPPL